MTSRQPRMAGEILVGASSSGKGRLADAFLSPQLRQAGRRVLTGLDSGRMRAMKEPVFGGGKWSDIAGGIGAIDSFALGFGTHVQTTDTSARSREVFEGIAQQSGVLTIDLNAAGPFTVDQAYTTTGDLMPDGKPEVFQKMVKVAGNKLRAQVLEGQGYRLEISMPLTQAGSQKGVLPIEEKGTFKLNLTGQVNAPAGTIAGSLESSNVVLKQLESAKVLANFVVNSNSAPNVQWKVLQNPGSLKIGFPSETVPAKGAAKASFSIARSSSTQSGTYPLVIEGSAFNGVTKFTLTTNVIVQTYWIESSRKTDGTSWTACASSDGDYGFALWSGPGLADYGTHALVALYGIESSFSLSGPLSNKTSIRSAFGARFETASLKGYAIKVGNDSAIRSMVYEIASSDGHGSTCVVGGSGVGSSSTSGFPPMPFQSKPLVAYIVK